MSSKRSLVSIHISWVSITRRYNGIIATKLVSKPSLRDVCPSNARSQWSKGRRGFRVPLCNTRSSSGIIKGKFVNSRAQVKSDLSLSIVFVEVYLFLYLFFHYLLSTCVVFERWSIYSGTKLERMFYKDPRQIIYWIIYLMKCQIQLINFFLVITWNHVDTVHGIV